MNETGANAAQIVHSVLAEAYTGGAARALAKYHLVDDTGELRQVTVKFPPGDLNGREVPGPIINPDVINRFLALDSSKAAKTFEWMLFAAGGGEPHLRESERALGMAKTWIVENRMKGQGRKDEKIKPMTRQEAEADWLANDYAKYHEAYYYADQDLAGDVHYPVFGWFREWPGRKNVYEKVVNGVRRWQELANNKKFVAEYNRTNPSDPFHLSLWEAEDKPRFKDADALLDFVGQVRANMARRKAEQNVVTVGKVPPEQGGGYRTGRDEVLYEDDLVKVVVPLTAGASLKKGFNDWCVANRTRWEDYFRSRDQSKLFWGSYTQRGPFAYMHLKQASPADSHLQSVALHVQLSAQPNTPNRIDFWDRNNQAAIRLSEIAQRMERAFPGQGAATVKKVVSEVEEWLKEFKLDQLERFPALEALMLRVTATELVNNLLG